MFDITAFVLKKEVTAITNKETNKKVKANEITGQLNSENLKYLTNLNKLVLEHKIYRLSRKEKNVYKYISKVIDNSSKSFEMIELSIDSKTGVFNTKTLIIRQASIEELKSITKENNNLADDKGQWDKKSTARVLLDNIDEGNYILDLRN